MKTTHLRKRQNLAGIEIEIPVKLFNALNRWAEQNDKSGAGQVLEEFLCSHERYMLSLHSAKTLQTIHLKKVTANA